MVLSGTENEENEYLFGPCNSTRVSLFGRYVNWVSSRILIGAFYNQSK